MNTCDTPAHTILWADDDADDLEMFRELLETHAPDHTLIEFGNGEHLLNYLQGIDQNRYPCLIVLDLNMPVMNGRETLQKLKQKPAFQNITTVVFSTSVTPADKLLCAALKAETYLKPPNYDQLQEMVKNLVAKCSRTAV